MTSEFFDNSEQIAHYQAELAKQPAEMREAKLNPNPDKGYQQIADLLTFLPEEERIGRVRSFVGAMLFD